MKTPTGTVPPQQEERAMSASEADTYLVKYEGQPVDKFGRPWVRVITNHDGGQSILWTCPLCYRGLVGQVADEPVSGWDAPRWTVTDGENGLTLTPSLGCPGMKDGSCPGHWWVRDGKLVAA